MSMKEWAKREVELYCEKTKDKDECFNYGGACAESALRAFNSLLEDGHSGMSIGITQQILNRLIDGNPLTPIEDIAEEWKECESCDKNSIMYQAVRCSSLFKTVNKETGEVEYNNVNEIKCVDISNPGWVYHNGFVKKIGKQYINNSIKFPYMPLNKPYKIYTEDFATTGEVGVFDTLGIFYIKTPAGETIDVNKFYKESKEGWIEITEKEFKCRKFESLYDEVEFLKENMSSPHETWGTKGEE